jgi:hypothetical protein
MFSESCSGTIEEGLKSENCSVNLVLEQSKELIQEVRVMFSESCSGTIEGIDSFREMFSKSCSGTIEGIDSEKCSVNLVLEQSKRD